MTHIRNVVCVLSRWACWMAIIGLSIMMFLTCADVILRYFGYPIKGTFDFLSQQGLNNAQFVRWGIDTSIYAPSNNNIKPPVRFIHNAGFGGTSF